MGCHLLFCFTSRRFAFHFCATLVVSNYLSRYTGNDNSNFGTTNLRRSALSSRQSPQTKISTWLNWMVLFTVTIFTNSKQFTVARRLQGRWPFDWRICNLWVTCDVLTCSSSILHMCFISVSRYLGIRNPLHARQSNVFVSRRAILWRIAIAWLSSALIASPITMMSLYDHKNIVPSANECAISNKYFMIFGSMLAFFIPMFVMVPSYVMTVRLLSRRAKFVRNNSLHLANSVHHNHHQSDCKQMTNSDTNSLATAQTKQLDKFDDNTGGGVINTNGTTADDRVINLPGALKINHNKATDKALNHHHHHQNHQELKQDPLVGICWQKTPTFVGKDNETGQVKVNVNSNCSSSISPSSKSQQFIYEGFLAEESESESVILNAPPLIDRVKKATSAHPRELPENNGLRQEHRQHRQHRQKRKQKGQPLAVCEQRKIQPSGQLNGELLRMMIHNSNDDKHDDYGTSATKSDLIIVISEPVAQNKLVPAGNNGHHSFKVSSSSGLARGDDYHRSMAQSAPESGPKTGTNNNTKLEGFLLNAELNDTRYIDEDIQSHESHESSKLHCDKKRHCELREDSSRSLLGPFLPTISSSEQQEKVQRMSAAAPDALSVSSGVLARAETSDAFLNSNLDAASKSNKSRGLNCRRCQRLLLGRRCCCKKCCPSKSAANCVKCTGGGGSKRQPSLNQSDNLIPSNIDTCVSGGTHKKEAKQLCSAAAAPPPSTVAINSKYNPRCSSCSPPFETNANYIKLLKDSWPGEKAAMGRHVDVEFTLPQCLDYHQQKEKKHKRYKEQIGDFLSASSARNQLSESKADHSQANSCSDSSSMTCCYYSLGETLSEQMMHQQSSSSSSSSSSLSSSSTLSTSSWLDDNRTRAVRNETMDLAKKTSAKLSTSKEGQLANRKRNGLEPSSRQNDKLLSQLHLSNTTTTTTRTYNNDNDNLDNDRLTTDEMVQSVPMDCNSFGGDHGRIVGRRKCYQLSENSFNNASALMDLPSQNKSYTKSVDRQAIQLAGFTINGPAAHTSELEHQYDDCANKTMGKPVCRTHHHYHYKRNRHHNHNNTNQHHRHHNLSQHRHRHQHRHHHRCHRQGVTAIASSGLTSSITRQADLESTLKTAQHNQHRAHNHKKSLRHSCSATKYFHPSCSIKQQPNKIGKATEVNSNSVTTLVGLPNRSSPIKRSEGELEGSTSIDKQQHQKEQQIRRHNCAKERCRSPRTTMLAPLKTESPINSSPNSATVSTSSTPSQSSNIDNLAGSKTIKSGAQVDDENSALATMTAIPVVPASNVIGIEANNRANHEKTKVKSEFCVLNKHQNQIDRNDKFDSKSIANSAIDSSMIVAALMPALPAAGAPLSGRSNGSRKNEVPMTRNSSNNSSGALFTSQNQYHNQQLNFNSALNTIDEPRMTRYLGSSMQVRSEQKATKVLGVVFFTFVICWTPFFVINFTQAFVERDQLSKWISNEMMTTFLWLGYISSTINPVIYTVFNRNFRRAFRQLLLCRRANHRYSHRSNRNSEIHKSFRFSQFGRAGAGAGGGFNSSLYSGNTIRNTACYNMKLDTADAGVNSVNGTAIINLASTNNIRANEKNSPEIMLILDDNQSPAIHCETRQLSMDEHQTATIKTANPMDQRAKDNFAATAVAAISTNNDDERQLLMENSTARQPDQKSGLPVRSICTNNRSKLTGGFTYQSSVAGTLRSAFLLTSSGHLFASSSRDKGGQKEQKSSCCD